MGPFSYGGSASKAIHYMAETQALGVISLGMSFGINPHKSNPFFVNLFEEESDQNKWKDKVHFGALLTGGSRIHCRQYRSQMPEQHEGDDCRR